ncbi:hypothetical protein KAR29_02775 [Aminithiophilus ramosus]|uniref:Winged helix-turn-helix domain-containing protein n=1 Tax=Aminithiophilus ramosus TaxID=3029084 RepID=A0A9Q7AP78_9BACT|nr:helix-turn-helix domain-containing protein [Aminithiophilus ramosus]QTX32863.1 hypothetical protein KAR29_02775 [Aminithiophilus ramosus]
MSRTKNQRQKVLGWLRDGRSLTSLEALSRFGCLRLASRIAELKKMGFPVEKEMISVESGAHVARYFLTTSREEKMEVA